MLSIAGMRKRLPPVVFVFLLLIAVMLLGLACACLTDHPMQAIDNALAAIPDAPPVIEVWPAIVLGFFAAALVLHRAAAARGRASPAVLQRFLL